ncbi:MAG TPA: hypothetical protein VJX67_23185, partial [Blastocatellia bacterium]|nr:hypothetical protein [Blastocatellia bacterium]
GCLSPSLTGSSDLQILKDHQARIADLLSAAFFAEAGSEPNLTNKVSGLREAVVRSPANSHYRIALGASLLLLGRSDEAAVHFEKAKELSPDDEIAVRASTVGLLATGQTREVKATIRAHSNGRFGRHLGRLSELRRLFVKGVETTEASTGAAANPEILHPTGDESGGVDARVDEHSPVVESQLIDILAAIVAGKTDDATARLDQIPVPDHSPEPYEAAALAVWLFYSASLKLGAGKHREALSELDQAEHLARSVQVPLPFLETATVCYAKIGD